VDKSEFNKGFNYIFVMPKADVISISPLGDRVVVKPESKEEKISASGIIIPESTNKERPAKGSVMAVGPGKTEDGKLVPIGVKVGQTVLFSKYGYEEVKIDGQEYYILSESQILAVINK
jgi:chaperonin GroES